MADATLLARVLAMQAEMYQIVVCVEGMKALNEWRASRGESQAYGEESFVAQSDSLGYLAGALREIDRGRPRLSRRPAVSADLAATKEPEAPQAPQECTGVAASWCPVHGNCSCTRDEEGMWMGDRSAWDCPLHGDASTHADAEVALLATPPEAPSEAERLLRLTCERLIGTPVVEQSSSLADISLALDAYCARIAEAHQERRPAVSAPLAEIIEEGRRMEAGGDGSPEDVGLALHAFYRQHGPRLLAVAEAAVEMRRAYDYALPILFEGPGGTAAEIEAETMMCEADAAFDAAARGAL